MHLVVVGGSDAGISAGLRARELDPTVEVTLVVADAYPNFSICGIPYYISGDVRDWHDLAHRTRQDLDDAGLTIRTCTHATRIAPARRELDIRTPDGSIETLGYDALVVGTGARPIRPPIDGLTGPDALGPADGVHLLHTMGDTFDLATTIQRRQPRSALVVGAGYIGLEMAEALSARGIRVTQVEQLREVLPTVDPELGALVHTELVINGVEVVTGAAVTRIARAASGLCVEGTSNTGPIVWEVDVVLVVVGVRPDAELLTAAGAQTGPRGAVLVDDRMATTLPQVWAAGDCVVTVHRQLGLAYLPLGTTAHKQGRVAGANAVGVKARFPGIVGTQVVKVFDLVAARTGLRDHEATATATGYQPITLPSTVNDHKAYYPTAHPITIRVTGDALSGKLLGAQLVGRLGTEIAKRVDIFATALHLGMSVADISDLDLSYTPPLGSPWDAVQMAAQEWEIYMRNRQVRAAG